MARKTKEAKRMEALVDDAFRRLGNNIQFNIMDLGKIHDAGMFALAGGQDLDTAMQAAIAKYRVPEPEAGSRACVFQPG